MQNFSLPRWSTIVDTTLDVTLGTHRRAQRAYEKLSNDAEPIPKLKSAKMHGFGLTKYTIFHPLGRVTKTTFHAQKRLWPERIDPAKNNNSVTHVPPEYDPQCFLPVPIRIDPALLNGMSVLRSDQYHADLLRKCKIRFADATNTGALLTHELHQCDKKLALYQPDEKSARIPLLLGLRRACNDVEAVTGEQVSEDNVARALAYLREQNLFASVLNPPLISTTRQLGKDERIARDLAWRLVYKMAITENGMELLHQFTDTPMPVVGEAVNDAEKNRQRRQQLNLKHFFKASNSLLADYIDLTIDPKPPLSADPSTLLRYCCRECEGENAPLNTLIIHGLPGIQQVMCEEERGSVKTFWQKRIARTDRFLENNQGNHRQVGTNQFSGNLSDNGLSDDHDTAGNSERTSLIALRERQQNAMNDRVAYKWVSDGHYSNAPGSFLHTVSKRFRKIEVHLERREMRHARTRTEAFFKRTREIALAKNRSFVPASGIISEQHNPDSMLLHREVMQSMLYLTEELLLRDQRLIGCSSPDTGCSTYTLERGPKRPVLKKIACLALLRQWQKKPLHYLSNNLAPTEFEIDKLVTSESLHQLFGDNPLLSGPRREELISAFKKEVAREALTPELLAEWVDDSEVDPAVPFEHDSEPIDGRKHGMLSRDQLREKFAESMSHLLHGRTSSVVLTGDPVKDFKEVLSNDIESMRLGNIRTFSGGVTRGFNLPLFSEMVSMVKSFGLVRLVVNGGYTHRSLANFEVGIPSSGAYIRFTCSHEDEANASVGVTVGPKSPIGAANSGVYATTAVEGNVNSNRAGGISLSLPRGGAAMTGCDGIKPGVNGDALVAKKLAEVMRILTDTDEAPPVPNDLFPEMRKLRRIAEVAPDISVSMIRSGDSRSLEKKGGGSAGTQLGVADQSKDYSLNFNATINATYARRRFRYRQRHVALDVEVISRGVRKSVSFVAKLPVMIGFGQKQGNYVESSHGPGKTSKLAGSPFGAVSINAELWKSGIATQTTRIVYDGKISKNCYGNVFYLNAKQFIAAAEKNRATWVNYAAAHDPECPLLPLSQHSEEDKKKAIEAHAIRRGLVEKHSQAFHAYLENVKKIVHQNNVFFDFLELTPESTITLNYYYQREIELRAAGCTAEADICKEVFDALWNNEDAWAPYFIVDSMLQQSNSGSSINIGVTLTGEQPVASSTFTNYNG